MKDYGKTSRLSMKGGVKQIKGPGMNKGLKKPRRAPGEPKDFGKPASMKMAKRPAFIGSYLPDRLGLGRKKSKP